VSFPLSKKWELSYSSLLCPDDAGTRRDDLPAKFAACLADFTPDAETLGIYGALSGAL